MQQESPKTIEITGIEVADIRVSLGFTVAQFATILAVHPSTVHRWESKGADSLPSVDGIASNVLLALRARLDEDEESRRKAREMGQAVLTLLAIGGALLALAALLKWLTNER